jgi:hypothetical protein
VTRDPHDIVPAHVEVSGPQSPAAFSTGALASPTRDKWVTVALKRSAAVDGFRTKTCPQCGTNPAPDVPVGIEVERPNPVRFLLAGFSAMLFALTMVVTSRSRVLRLPLCADCVELHRRGRAVRGVGLGALVLSPGVGVVLMVGAGGAPWPFVVAAIASVAGIVGCIAAYRRTRADVIRWLRSANRDVMLLSASPSFLEVVAREAPEAFPIDLPPRR